MSTLLEEIPVEQEEAPVVTNAAVEGIEVRAYFRYIERGRVDGFALDDWLTAQEELSRETDS